MKNKIELPAKKEESTPALNMKNLPSREINKDQFDKILELRDHLLEGLKRLKGTSDFWAGGYELPDYKPFKDTTIIGRVQRRLKAQIQTGNQNIIINKTEDVTISQIILIDLLIPYNSEMQSAEDWYETFQVNADWFKDKKETCKALGILYICDYNLARIFDKVHAII
jgi:hypothetical protein